MGFELPFVIGPEYIAVALFGVVIIRLRAHARSIGAHIENDEAAAGYLLGHVFHGPVRASSAVINNYRRHTVMAGCTSWVIEFAVELGAACIYGNVFNLYFAHIGLHELGKEAADEYNRRA